MPSRKWFAARVIAVTGLVTMWLSTGSWDTEESIALVSLVSAGAVAYLTPNESKDP